MKFRIAIQTMGDGKERAYVEEQTSRTACFPFLPPVTHWFPIEWNTARSKLVEPGWQAGGTTMDDVTMYFVSAEVAKKFVDRVVEKRTARRVESTRYEEYP